MFKIPRTFSEDHDNYITLSGLKNFCKDHKLPISVDRMTAINNIEQFADSSEEKCELVKDWLDGVLVEGIKDLMVKNVDDPGTINGNIEQVVQEQLNGKIADENNRHYSNQFTPALQVFRYDIDDNVDTGKRIRLYMGKVLDSFDKRVISGLMYPILVEYYIDLNIIVARSKSKSHLYEHMDTFDIEKAKSTTAEKEMKVAIDYVCNLFGITLHKAGKSGITNRKRLYQMLNKYTETPDEIKRLILDKSVDINGVVETMMSICNLPLSFRADLHSDIENMTEKYFSISYKDKSIFTANRDIYPLQLCATDEEESKVEQTAALEDPLQSKAIFFDNKKMLQKSGMCDGTVFMCRRNNTKYCSDEYFRVKMTNNKDYCILKFFEYTAEEDMIYVLLTLTFPERAYRRGQN